jgi:histidinol phosphatase-like PHP family hydrolase
MVLNDAVEDVAANEAKFTVNSRKGTLDESPLVCLVVRRLGMSVVQVGNGNCSEC